MAAGQYKMVGRQFGSFAITSESGQIVAVPIGKSVELEIVDPVRRCGPVVVGLFTRKWRSGESSNLL